MKALDEATKDQLDGGLGVDLSLPTWLKKQPESTQRQILGHTRWKLWIAGKLPLTAMVHTATGKPLSLEQLAARRRRAVA